MKKLLYVIFLSSTLLFTACGAKDDERSLEDDPTYVDEEVVEDTGSTEIAKEFLDYVLKGDKENAKKLCQEDFYKDLDDIIKYYEDKFSADKDYKAEFADFKEEFVGSTTTIVFVRKSTYKGKYLEEPQSLHFNQQEDGSWLINGR